MIISLGTAYFMARIMMFLFGIFGKKPPLSVKEVHYIGATVTASSNKARERLGYEVTEPLGEAIEKACQVCECSVSPEGCVR